MKEFYTISKNETTEIIEKKSKFIADIYPVKNVEEAENKKTETDKTETNQEEQSNVAEQTKDEEHQENKEKVKSEN